MEREEEGDVVEEEEEGVEEREVEEEEWKVDVEDLREDVVVRGNMRGNLVMVELELRPKISVEVVERATGVLSRMMPRKEMRLQPTPLLRKLPLLMVKLLLKAKPRKNPLRTKSQLKRRWSP